MESTFLIKKIFLGAKNARQLDRAMENDMNIGSERFRAFWIKHLKRNYKFIYTRGGFGWVKKKISKGE